LTLPASGATAAPSIRFDRITRHAALGASIDWALPATLLVTGMSLRMAGTLTPVVLGCVMLAALGLRPLGAALLAVCNLALAALVVKVSLEDATVLAVFPAAMGFVAQRWRQPVVSPSAERKAALAIQSYESCPDGVVVLDAQARVIDANPAACAMLGYERAAMVGVCASGWATDAGDAGSFAPLRPDGRSAPLRRVETVCRRRDGSCFPAQLCLSQAARDGQAILYIRDISDRRAGEHARDQQAAIMAGLIESQTQDLVMARAELDAAARAKDCFLANVSHQIRTPLHAIKAFASLGSRLTDDQGAQMRSHLARIRTSAEELNAFMDDLLILSSLEPAAATAQFERLDIGLLLEQACMDAQERLGTRDLDLKTDIRIKGRLWSDAHLMARLGAAMIGFASARSPAGSTVALAARFHKGFDSLSEAPGCLIEVCDTGTGLQAGEAPERLDAYFQQELMDTHAANQALLLAICRQISRLHGGEIRLANVDGGVALSVWLPVAASPAT